MQPHDLSAEYRARIEAASSDRQALADINLELLRDSHLGHEEEHALQARIDQLLAGSGGWGDLLPSALVLCPYCGVPRDRRPGGRISPCWCAGMACRRCRAGRINRPGTNHYQLDDHRLWHTPYFAQLFACRHCRASNEAGELIKRVRMAAERLAAPRQSAGERLPRHDLVALHGAVEQWHGLRLGPPPDGRPLYVGRSLAAVQIRSSCFQVATWRTPWTAGERERVLHELLIRWQPPLNHEIETPWNRRLDM